MRCIRRNFGLLLQVIAFTNFTSKIFSNVHLKIIEIFTKKSNVFRYEKLSYQYECN